MRGLVSLLRLFYGQYRSRATIERLQSKKLRRLVRHAYSHVPYYRRLLESVRLRPEDIRGLGDMHKIPLTSKRQLQASPVDEITALGTDLSRCIRTRTSGATGTPLEIVSTKSDRSIMNPSFITAYFAWGLKPWHRLMFLEGRPESLRRKSWYENLSMLPRKSLSVWDDPKTWIEELLLWKPHLLQGYSLNLKLLAEAVVKYGVRNLYVPLVVNTSGMISHHGRRMLESVLGAKVVDIYASEEAGGVIAWECPYCSRHHVNVNTLIVEFLDNGKSVEPGKEAEIVITNLHNFTMPFIRYRQEDIGIFSNQEPSCKRGLPLMQEIRGRSGDYVILPSGEKLTPHPFFLVLDDIVGVGEWRLTQKKIDEIHVEVATTVDSKEHLCAEIVRKLNSVVGNKIKTRVFMIDQIRRTPSQKLRSVVSEVTDFQNRESTIFHH